MTIAPINRWLYRGRRPNWIARVLNGLGAAVASTGATAKVGMVTLEVLGRKSGQTISLPVAVVVVNGERYLVSMLGEDVQWVKNVRAAAGRAVLRTGGREQVILEEVPAEQRAPILRAYLQRAPGARPHVPVDKDAPLAEFERVASAYPVFRVTSPSSESRA
jgi:deazaflavin-dependent oxidoreductase (nitroreductase family)